MPKRLIWLVFGLLLVACAPPALPVSVLTPLPPVQILPPPLDPTDSRSVCDAALRQQGHDWPRVLELLVTLAAADEACPAGVPARQTLYTAHIAYAETLLEQGDSEAAEGQFRAALALDATRSEAVAGLERLGISLPPPLPGCDHDVLEAAFAGVAPYAESDLEGMVRIRGGAFALADRPFVVRGVNYIPAGSADPVAWLGVDPAQLTAELDLIAEAGFNTVRVALALDRLFQCPGSGAVPIPEAVAQLDVFLHEAAVRGLRVLVVLNHAPDLTDYPLYDRPVHTQDQLRYVVERYRGEPAVFGWDLRAGGDGDYGNQGTFTREQVLHWLAETAALVHSWDGNHPVTAAWTQDELATLPYVDFVSFQHWDSIVALRARLANLQAGTGKPVVMAAFGYSAALMPEQRQAQFTQEAIQIGELDGLAGWMVWTAFDGVSGANAEGFGLWTVDYAPRPVLGLVKIALFEPAAEATGS